MQKLVDRAKKKKKLKSLSMDDMARSNVMQKCTTSLLKLYTNTKDSNFEIKTMRKNLGKKEKRALILSWERLTGNSGPRRAIEILVTVFEKTLSKEPRGKNAFEMAATKRTNEKNPETSMIYNHALWLASVLDCVIRDKAEIEPQLLPLSVGKYHASMTDIGLVWNIWETFGRCFANVMTSQDVVRGVHNAAHAWNMLIAIIVDQIRSGFDQQTRLNKQNKTLQPNIRSLLRSKSEEVADRLKVNPNIKKQSIASVQKKSQPSFYPESYPRSPMSKSLATSPPIQEFVDMSSSEEEQRDAEPWRRLSAQEKRYLFLSPSPSPTHGRDKIRSHSYCDPQQPDNVHLLMPQQIPTKQRSNSYSRSVEVTRKQSTSTLLLAPSPLTDKHRSNSYCDPRHQTAILDSEALMPPQEKFRSNSYCEIDKTQSHTSQKRGNKGKGRKKGMAIQKSKSTDIPEKKLVIATTPKNPKQKPQSMSSRTGSIIADVIPSEARLSLNYY